MSKRDFWQIHSKACESRELSYVDPDSGLRVFTEFGLRSRGKCCGSGCRHCPYAHESVAIARRASIAKQPTWLTAERPTGAVDVLFWSGGKDSFLAYLELVKSRENGVVLLTTFDGHQRRVAHQEIDIQDVVRQAEALAVPLLGVPLFSEIPYEARLDQALAHMRGARRLVFGDLHLQHIRTWREQSLGPLAAARNLTLHFPVWQVDYERLLTNLEASGVLCDITAVAPEWRDVVRVGDRFNREFIARLPAGVDAFGERGEFHTLARVWDR